MELECVFNVLVNMWVLYIACGPFLIVDSCYLIGLWPIFESKYYTVRAKQITFHPEFPHRKMHIHAASRIMKGETVMFVT